MNLLRGRIELADGRVVVVLGSERLVIPGAVLDDRPSFGGWIGEEVVIGIRPEAVHVADGDTPAGHALELEVVLVKALGSDLLAPGQPRPVARPRRKGFADTPFRAHPTSVFRSTACASAASPASFG
jgi:hypothetical protein